jgi:hypothetical protein
VIDRAGDEYTCALCRETFFKGVSDKQALEETRSHFGDVPEEELAVVCDDCWQKIHPQRN